MSKGFIRYEQKNGVDYASVYKAKRIDGKKANEVEYLGRVVDKENGVFVSRERGVFAFSLEHGYADPPTEILPPEKERLILDFGDAFLLHEILIKSRLYDVIGQSFPDRTDTLLALLAHRILDTVSASRYAMEWWEGSYARFLYPKAALRSQRVSEFLNSLGEEARLRDFFHTYLSYIVGEGHNCGILVDSTGLPNDIRFPLTAVNNHNGLVSNEARLILVIDRRTGMPIYFRYAAGNIVDVTTLKTTLIELEAYGVNVNYAIVDAGYYSEGNIRALQDACIPFIVRLVPNRKLYKDLVAQYAQSLEDAKYLVKYGQRLVFIRQVEINLFGKSGYAYIAVDMDRKHDEVRKYVLSALSNNDHSDDEINDAIRKKGLFVLLSAEDVDTRDILPLYYERQAIEQVFDFSKNNADLLPLRSHSVETFRGHLLLSFITSAVYLAANKMLADTGDSALGSFHLFRNLKCKVFDKSIAVQEANKRMIQVAKSLKSTIPLSLPLW